MSKCTCHRFYSATSDLCIAHFTLGSAVPEQQAINMDRAWATGNRKAEEATKEIYNSWKEELEKLLIFAGLFSAIVATFTVESSKAVLGDPAEEMVLLLRTLVFQANNLSNPRMNLPIDLAPEPPITPYAQTINLLYSVSLVLSLAAVLGGILCLQWLREFSRNITDVPHEEDLYLQHRRNESLQSWGVLWLLNALPLLLLVALALFFVGFSVAQWESRTLAAIPVTVIITISVLFIVITSLLPGLQLIILAKYRKPAFDEVGVSKAAPTLCPYRSPQAWLVHSMLRTVISPIQYIPSERSLNPERLQPFGKITSWTEYDTWWTKKHQTPTSIVPALRWIAKEFRQSHGVLPTTFNCLLLAMTKSFVPALDSIKASEQLSLFWMSALDAFQREFSIDASRSICGARLKTFVTILNSSGPNARIIMRNISAALLPARDSKALLCTVYDALIDPQNTLFTDESASAVICHLIYVSSSNMKYGNEGLFSTMIAILKAFVSRYQQSPIKSTCAIHKICSKIRDSLEAHYRDKCNDTLLRIFNSVVQDLDPTTLKELGVPLKELLPSVDVDDISKDNANTFVEIVEGLIAGIENPSSNPIVMHVLHVIKHLRYPDRDTVDARLVQALENEIHGTPRDSVISPLPLPIPTIIIPNDMFRGAYCALDHSLSKLIQAIINQSVPNRREVLDNDLLPSAPAHHKSHGT